jgi:hypothetical protein
MPFRAHAHNTEVTLYHVDKYGKKAFSLDSFNVNNEVESEFSMVSSREVDFESKNCQKEAKVI